MIKTRQTGFTLIEILVTVAIMAILMTVAANGFNRSNSKQNLKAAADALAGDMQSTALAALNSQQHQLQTAGYWGIHFDLAADTYIIFADFDSDQVYDTNEKFKSVTLSKNIHITAICFTVCGVADGDLAFAAGTAIPAYQGTVITNLTGDMSVELTDSVTSAVADVILNPFGGVSVQ